MRSHRQAAVLVACRSAAAEQAFAAPAYTLLDETVHILGVYMFLWSAMLMPFATSLGKKLHYLIGVLGCDHQVAGIGLQEVDDGLVFLIPVDTGEHPVQAAVGSGLCC
jgi:hypothetical protein